MWYSIWQTHYGVLLANQWRNLVQQINKLRSVRYDKIPQHALDLHLLIPSLGRGMYEVGDNDVLLC